MFAKWTIILVSNKVPCILWVLFFLSETIFMPKNYLILINICIENQDLNQVLKKVFFLLKKLIYMNILILLKKIHNLLDHTREYTLNILVDNVDSHLLCIITIQVHTYNTVHCLEILKTQFLILYRTIDLISNSLMKTLNGIYV